MTRRASVLALTLLLLISPALAESESGAPPAPKVGFKILPARDAVQPGGELDLALAIDIEKGWHIYHPLMLDTGAPTTFTFYVPPGCEVGPLRFPAPALGSEEGIEYLGLEGQFVVLTSLKVPADAKPGPLSLHVQMKALICKELCIPLEKLAQVDLKIAAEPGQPANEKTFEEAREALPKPLAKAPYLEGSAVSIDKDKLGPAGETEVTLALKIKRKHHILDPKPGVEDLIPSRVFVEQLDGLKVGAPIWPAPKIKKIEGLGEVREQSGDVTVRVPVSIIDEKFPSAPVSLRVLLSYQSCIDDGTCFPPEWAEGTVQFTADTGNPPPERGRIGTWLPLISHEQPPKGKADDATPSAPATPSTQAASAIPAAPAGLVLQILAALLGGLILNVMPCVFPVISLKIVGFVKQAGEDRARILKLGLAFCAGIMVWFWLFAFLTSLGQVPLANPLVVITLAAILFLFALNLFGVFEIILPGAAAGALSEATAREGYSGAFLKGLLATLLGTACTGPFFAGAAAYAATQPPAISFSIFTAAGVGMALPYLLLSAFPQWLKSLPKPGPWMVTFKQAMGFVLAGTAVWLLYILADLLDARGVVWTVGFLCFLALAAWLVGRIDFTWSNAARTRAWLAAACILVVGWWFSFEHMYPLRAIARGDHQQAPVAGTPVEGSTAADAVLAAVQQADWSEHVPWQAWRPGLPEELSSRGYTVYVDFTATWCVTCQTNKAVAVDVDSTRQRMKSAGVIPLKGDYTKMDPAIRKVLLAHGHNSVPLNLVYPAGQPNKPIQLPVLLASPGVVHEALTQAGPSQPKPVLAELRP